MARVVPWLWLAGAALYLAGTLPSVQTERDGRNASAPIPINETIGAKLASEPLSSSMSESASGSDSLSGNRDSFSGKDKLADHSDSAASADLPPLPRPEPRPFHRGEWVEVVGYTAVGRTGPESSTQVLAGYPVGQPFRVIARHGEFVRVQDLRSGKFGWMREASLTAYTGFPRPYAPTPVLVAAAPKEESQAAQPAPQKVAEAPRPRKATSVERRRKAFALGPAAETKAEDDSAKTRKRGRWRVAERYKDDSFPALIQRAFGGQ